MATEIILCTMRNDRLDLGLNFSQTSPYDTISFHRSCRRGGILDAE